MRLGLGLKLGCDNRSGYNGHQIIHFWGHKLYFSDHKYFFCNILFYPIFPGSTLPYWVEVDWSWNELALNYSINILNLLLVSGNKSIFGGLMCNGKFGYIFCLFLDYTFRHILSLIKCKMIAHIQMRWKIVLILSYFSKCRGCHTIRWIFPV